MLEKRNHIAGNCYTTREQGIDVHQYGPHIFHTSNAEVWEYVNNLSTFNNFVLSPIANYKGQFYNLPFNMNTFNKMWGVKTPAEAKKIIESQASIIQSEPQNLEEQAIKLVGFDVYNKLIQGYTEKQWKKDAHLLPKEIIKRLPVRYTYDNNYFNDKYQGIPEDGYTAMFERLLDGVQVCFDVDYLSNKDEWNAKADKVIYTGAIDSYFNYIFGYLEYKTTDFKHDYFDVENHQGVAIINYTDKNVPYTRTIEHKHFRPEVKTDFTIVTTETPVQYVAKKSEPYYPVNDEKNNALYEKYRSIADTEINVHFGGRLAEYKYYDMDKVILHALQEAKKEIISYKKK